MPDYTLIYADQAQELEEAQMRLLPPDLVDALYDLDKEVLDARGWKSLLLPDDFRLEARPYGDPNWPVKDGAPEKFSFYEPLFRWLQRQGRREVIVSIWPGDDAEFPEPNDYAYFCRCPLDARLIIDAYKALTDAAPRLRAMILGEMLLFDARGDWISVGTRGEGYLLCGDPAVIDGYYEAAGGEDIVRAYYYHYEMHIETDWTEETGLPLPYQAKLYDFVGWPYPVYPKKHNDLWRKGLDWSPMFGDRIRSIGPSGPDPTK